ncbi:MAG: long-chain fatty acid--CoA ligase, partial [Christensenellaceae bacterium]|nr:long-chain fatty acid--CoA ligase [Christensenellaceae bacterium]
NGFIYMVGRAGDVINVGGLKVAPTEVEEAALRHEDVKDCVCTAAQDARMGNVVCLLVVPKEGKAFDGPAIQKFLRQYLEAYKVPKMVKEIDQVPRTYNGKIDRKRVKV